MMMDPGVIKYHFKWTQPPQAEGQSLLELLELGIELLVGLRARAFLVYVFT